MSESEQKMIEILRILNEQDKPTGSKFIANKLKTKGYNLGERAVRYHMKILDEKGYSERMGYSGRIITELGKSKLEKGLMYDQVDFVFSKFKEFIYQTDFDYNRKKGSIIVNNSNILEYKAFEIIKTVFESDLCLSPLIDLKKKEINGKTAYTMNTICGTTIDGTLLYNGIPSIPLYGGLVKVEDYVPTKFTELISYKKTSISPLDAFISKNTTSVLDVVDNGTGLIPANFRLIPASGSEKTKEILNGLKKSKINGILGISDDGENILGIPVPEGMIGIGIIGGIAPFCAAQELGYNVDIKVGEKIMDYEELTPITKTKPILKNVGNKKYHKIPFLLSKAWNLIQSVKFNMDTLDGKIVANVSTITKDNLDYAIEIMENTYKNSPEYINPYYQIIESSDKNKVGIATVCSLTIDGILVNNGIMCTPKYGGLLELGNPPLFIEMISYNGSSIDPHKIFISKDMTSVNRLGQKPTKILASTKEIPYIARNHSEEILNKLNNINLPIYKIGKPRELIYNAKVDNYNFGIVAGSGLNTIATLYENDIQVDVKIGELLLQLSEMEKL